MKVWTERSHWGDAVELGIGIHWPDWHLREFTIDITVLRWVFTVVVSFL